MLLVTARRAEAAVRAAVAGMPGDGPDVEVRIAPRDVAALLIPDEVAPLLDGGEWDIVILPGLIRGDVAALASSAGVRVVKGPRYAFDLPSTLAELDDLPLSPDEPADALLSRSRAERAGRLLKDAEAVDIKGPSHEVRGLRIGRGLPVRVLAEIDDCDARPTDEVVAKAQRFLDEGAEIIDLGFTVDATAIRAAEIVEAVLPLGAPVSVDTLNPDIINAAVDAGVHMVLSLHPDNLDKVRPTDAVCVVVPGPGDKVQGVLSMADRARARGFTRIVLDPVLDPPGFGLARSLAAYAHISGTSDLPVLMGVGNAVELMDADSPGANAMLCAIAHELGVAVILTVEASHKTRGTVRECRAARDMMVVAGSLGTYPKDLGISLLGFKDKVRVRDPVGSDLTPEPQSDRSPDLEGGVALSISVTTDDRIQCLVQRDGVDVCLVDGVSARQVWSEVLARGLVRALDHVAYLGAELARAEIAIAAGKGYVQDEPLFRRQRRHWE